MDWAALLRALIAAGIATLGAYVHVLKRNVDQVHVLVNGNLSEIKRQLAAMTLERDKLADDDLPPPPRPLPRNPLHGYPSV